MRAFNLVIRIHTSQARKILSPYLYTRIVCPQWIITCMYGVFGRPLDSQSVNQSVSLSVSRLAYHRTTTSGQFECISVAHVSKAYPSGGPSLISSCCVEIPHIQTDSQSVNQDRISSLSRPRCWMNPIRIYPFTTSPNIRLRPINYRRSISSPPINSVGAVHVIIPPFGRG